ncbi:PF08818 domain protein [Leptospira weilii serovar Ranarum str. ICFT]|uniref:PF08818 domain protein n=1 Tax=Leptospira weilii serovar Ranarum str. ICFT TaxID=1218598 RepID=N1WQX8_9LEPT|nr:DUF1801 domain-containing protein [Leptospira weilii]EMY79499.1 PF08818 domain protein [Leptospira weilii serovar Ranarum str. ICFT]
MYLFSFIPVPTFIMSSEIHRFFYSQPEIRRERMLALRSWIVESFPEILESMQSQIPSYHLNENWIAIGFQKNNLSIYLCQSGSLKTIRNKFPSLVDDKARMNFADKEPFPWREVESSIRLILKSKTKSDGKKKSSKRNVRSS